MPPSSEVAFALIPHFYVLARVITCAVKIHASELFHTYSAYGCSAGEFMGIFGILDATPKGRNETGPNHLLADWDRPHNMYGKDGEVEANGRYHDPGCDCAAHGP